MDFGIVLGTMTAAALAGRYAPVWKVPARSLIEAVIGGLMLGYGARLAYGCNIGAYFSGIRQPVRLVVAGRSFRRQRSRHAPAAGVRSRSGTCSPDRLPDVTQPVTNAAPLVTGAISSRYISEVSPNNDRARYFLHVIGIAFPFLSDSGGITGARPAAGHSLTQPGQMPRNTGGFMDRAKTRACDKCAQHRLLRQCEIITEN